MRTKQHNKKRNTAFLFEVLVREYTKAAMAKNEPYRKCILSVIREHFNKKTQLGKELALYRSLYKESGIPRRIAEKYLAEAKRIRASFVNPAVLYSEQSTLIGRIHELEHERETKIFDNFVPNYKSLATISQIFGRQDLNVKSRVILEESLIKTMTHAEGTLQESILEPVDSLTYKTFSKKFEETYASKLLTEQKQLLNKLIFSFTDGGVGFKVYLNEELGRLKSTLMKAFQAEKDPMLLENANKVQGLIESFAKQPINEETLMRVMQIQELAKELAN